MVPQEVEAPYPEETALMTQAVPKVRALFAAGRRAAHEALSRLGAEAKPILKGERGVPLWPMGTIGSIAHTAGLAVAVVGAKPQILGLGIDVEKSDRKVSLDLIQRVASLEEQAWVQHQPFRLLRLLSAKEAVFKTFYPLHGVYLVFIDAQLENHPWGFEGQLLKNAGSLAPLGTRFRVLQTVQDGYLLSGCCFGP